MTISMGCKDRAMMQVPPLMLLDRWPQEVSEFLGIEARQWVVLGLEQVSLFRQQNTQILRKI